MNNSEVISLLELNDYDMIGYGLHRECYSHPTDANLCVKVIVRGEGEEMHREEKYYQHLIKRNISWVMLPEFHGYVETNKGTGALFDLVRDYNGDPSSSMKYLLLNESTTEKYVDRFVVALKKLKSYLMDNRIITMDIKERNLLYQQVSDKDGQFVIIDGIGNSDLLPICNYSRFFAQRKIQRKWTKFIDALNRKYPENKAVHEILRKLEAT